MHPLQAVQQNRELNVRVLAKVTKLEKLKVYSDKGLYVGAVDDVIIDFEKGSIYGLYIENTNSELVESGAAISIPYRLVKTIGHVIILKGFPEFVKVNDMK